MSENTSEFKLPDSPLPRGVNGHLVVPTGSSGLAVSVYPFRVGTDRIYLTGPPVLMRADAFPESIAEDSDAGADDQDDARLGS
jgi:hypothetical protein